MSNGGIYITCKQCYTIYNYTIFNIKCPLCHSFNQPNIMNSYTDNKNGFLNNTTTDRYNRIQIEPVNLINKYLKKEKLFSNKNNYYTEQVSIPITNSELNQKKNIYIYPENIQYYFNPDDIRKCSSSENVYSYLYNSLQPTKSKQIAFDYGINDFSCRSPENKINNYNIYKNRIKGNTIFEERDNDFKNDQKININLSRSSDRIPRNSKPKTLRELEIGKAKIILKKTLNKKNLNKYYFNIKRELDFNKIYIDKNLLKHINTKDSYYTIENSKTNETIQNEYKNSKQPMDNQRSKKNKFDQKINNNIFNINVFKNSINYIKKQKQKQKYLSKEYQTKINNIFPEQINSNNKPLNFIKNQNISQKETNETNNKGKLATIEKYPLDNCKYNLSSSDNSLQLIKNKNNIRNSMNSNNKNQNINTNNISGITQNKIRKIYIDREFKNINNNNEHNSFSSSKISSINKIKLIDTSGSNNSFKEIKESSKDKNNFRKNDVRKKIININNVNNQNQKSIELQEEGIDLFINEKKLEKKQKQLDNINNINKNDNKEEKKIIKNEAKKIDLVKLRIDFKNIDVTPIYAKRKSFDCIMGRKIFDMLNKDNLETKTFNSEDYTIIRQIGKGSYGKIYLVEDPKTKKNYALKKVAIGDVYELNVNQEE